MKKTLRGFAAMSPAKRRAVWRLSALARQRKARARKRAAQQQPALDARLAPLLRPETNGVRRNGLDVAGLVRSRAALATQEQQMIATLDQALAPLGYICQRVADSGAPDA